MEHSIIELTCFECIQLDNYQYVASFHSTNNEKYQMTFHEKVPIDTLISINTYYHTLQKFNDYTRISINQDYITQHSPDVLELFLVDKYETKDNNQIAVYNDSNTLETFKMIDYDSNLALNSKRFINLPKEKLVIIKEAHIYKGNYVIENWIHRLGQK